MRRELDSLVDPALSYSEIRPTRIRAGDTRHLKWLFARNTVDVIKPIESSYLLAPVSATCGNREMLVRFGAKPDYYHARYIINGDNPAGSGHPDKAEQFQFYAEKFEKLIRETK
ncbi:hypothetical protein [Burkholderia anthina]|uniref:hypothetical protein n=1 Tax=Burkholderia anthina TaxID=179879 RepID=UPI00158BA2A6